MNNKCYWIEETFIPCDEMKQNLDSYKIHNYISHKRSNDGCGRLDEITKCPHCTAILKNINYINKLNSEIRKFQIRNLDSGGCGSYYYVKVPINSTLDQIADLINEKLTEEYEKDKANRQFRYFGMPKSNFSSNRNMKIVELNVLNNNTKRKGLKGIAYLCTTKFKGINIMSGNKFEKEYGYFNVEWR